MLRVSQFLATASLAGGAYLAPACPHTVLGRRRAGADVVAQMDLNVVNLSDDDDDDGASGFVREPPPYPEGLHDAAKADREGPFWSTLGEPDVSTGVRPPYLRRDDWHISSRQTDEERVAIEEEMDEYINSVVIELPEAMVQKDDVLDPFAPSQYMRTEDEVAMGATKSKLPMPQTWQEYQFMQDQLSLYSTDSALSEANRAAALKHEEALIEFYDTFKSILAEGWTLLNDNVVEDAVKFIGTVKKSKK